MFETLLTSTLFRSLVDRFNVNARALAREIESVFELGMVDFYDRNLAAAVFIYVRDASRWEVSGSSFVEPDGCRLFVVKALAPECDGGCGGRTGSVTGMCFECQCEAHSAGWYDMDEGYARV